MTGRRLAIGVGLLAVLALALWATTRPRLAPDLDFVLTGGGKVSLEGMRGHPVLITFWASTCPSCLAEMPHLAELYRDLSPDGLRMIAVAMPYDPPPVVLDLVHRRGLPYPVSFDLESKVVHAFGDVRVTPTNVLISPQGEILFQQAGRLNMIALRQRLHVLLGGE